MTQVAGVEVPGSAGPDRPDPIGAVSSAPYALVRVAALAPPPEPRIAHQYRMMSARLVDRIQWCAEHAPAVTALLHDRAGSSDSEKLRRRVLLPLRRDVHNGRSPRPALRAALADLPDPPPLLLRWLAARDEIDAVAASMTSLAPEALRAERGALAELCRAEPLRRAVAYTSQQLLNAVCRAAEQGAHPDDRSRKSEPNVLRYALRATTRTSPLSWFTHVGWGLWSDPAGSLTSATNTVVAAAQPDRGTVDLLVDALLTRRELRGELPHRLAPGLRLDGQQVRFRRAVPVSDPKAVGAQEDVTIPLTGPLRLVLQRAEAAGTVTPRELMEALIARLPGPPGEALAVADRYIASLLKVGLLGACRPFDPQAKDVIGALTNLLAELKLVTTDPPDCAAGTARDLARTADLLVDIDRTTRAFPQLPAAQRSDAFEQLNRDWAEALVVAAGAPTGTPSGAGPALRRTPLTEDVTLSGTLRLDAEHGLAAREDLARLVPLFEIFDAYALVRRAARDCFVARYGAGGRCTDLIEFGREYGQLWRLPELSESDSSRNPEHAGSVEFRRLLRLRADLARLAAGNHAPIGAAGPAGAELVLPDRVVDEAARRLPDWLRCRPTSYSVFAQPLGSGGDRTGPAQLCVNAVYGGWGRYTSRFLDAFDPSAAAAVAAQIRDTVGPHARLAQLRPVRGFNANLHPRLVTDEVSEDPAWGTVPLDQLHLVHDPASDQLRLLVASTGECINLLYLGFLIPLALPDWMMPLVTDLGSGMVAYGQALTPQTEQRAPVGVITHRPRLRFRTVLLQRAQWQLTPDTVAAWRAELDAEPGPPVRAAARWRGHLGLPEKVFVAAARGNHLTQLEMLRSPDGPAKAQYVDLGSVLHLRNLSRTLARYPDGIVVEEALPEPTAGRHTVEIVTELYRRAR